MAADAYHCTAWVQRTFTLPHSQTLKRIQSANADRGYRANTKSRCAG